MASALARRFYAALPQRNSPLRLQRAFTPQLESSTKNIFNNEELDQNLKAKSPIASQELQKNEQQEQQEQQEAVEMNEGQGQDDQVEMFMGKNRVLLPNEGLLTHQTKSPPPGHHYHAPRLSIHIPPKHLKQRSWRPQEQKQQHLAEESPKSLMKRIRKEIVKRREMERAPEFEVEREDDIEELREDFVQKLIKDDEDNGWRDIAQLEVHPSDIRKNIRSSPAVGVGAGAGIGSRHFITTPTQPQRGYSTSSKDGESDPSHGIISNKYHTVHETTPANRHYQPIHQPNDHGNIRSHIVKTFEQSIEVLSDDPSHQVYRSHVFIKIEEDNKKDECFATASEAIDSDYDDPIRNFP
jgi:hypothetical protein